MTARPGLTRLSVKLGLVLFVTVAGALAIVGLAVLPQLESRLVDAKTRELARVMRTASASVRASSLGTLPQIAAALQGSFNARAVVFEELTSHSLRSVADSSGLLSTDVRDDPIALTVLRTGLPASGRVSREGHAYAEAAAPAGNGRVVLLSAPLSDALANVRLVRRYLVIAGSIALAVSWLAGYLAALGITRRISRLEAAAERIAGGDFSEPVVDPHRDEIGELARAFETMRQRLSQLDHARREFIANASHELRTPLFSLGGFLELFDDEDLDESTRREFLAEMRAQVERMTRLATDLLDLTRLDAGQLAVEAEDVDLAAVARTAADEFRAVAEAEGHELRPVADDMVNAVGDEQRILQIARILIENALRHTPRGTTVSVGVRRWEARAMLEVRDDGPEGIPASERDSLFARFYRGQSSKASGSGLGLAIARELATKMGGTLRVESRPGQTVFALSLPLSGVVAVAPISRENAELSRSGSSTRA
jgi:signal transduction histidine kinase